MTGTDTVPGDGRDPPGPPDAPAAPVGAARRADVAVPGGRRRARHARHRRGRRRRPAVGTDLRPHLPALGAVALVLWGYGQLVTGRLLTGLDVITYSLPNRVQAAAALRHLHLPQWDPFRFAGAPFLANPQAAVLYPLHWPLLPLPQDRAQSVALVLHVLIGALGTYALATRALRVSPLGGAVAGAGFALSGFVHAHIGHFEQTTSLAWLPWALLAADRAVAARRPRTAARPVAGLAVALALAALAGHTQYLYMTLAFVAGYAVLVARPWSRLLRVAAGMGLGLALAAVQLVPTGLLVGRSIRRGGLPFRLATSYSVPRRRLVAAFLPDYAKGVGPGPVEWWAWLPWAVLALAAVAVVTRQGGRPARALALLALAGTVLALGRGTPVYRPLYEWVPALDAFRAPGRWLLVPELSLAVLAGAGIDAVRRGDGARRRPVAAVLVVVGLAAAGGIWGRGLPGTASLRLGGAAAGFTIVVWLAARRRPRWGRGAALLVAGVVTAELLAANAHAYVRWARMESGRVLRRSAAAAALHDPSGGRVLSLGPEDQDDLPRLRRTLRANAFVYDRVRSVDGYDGGLLVERHWVRAMAALTRRPDFDPELDLRANVGPPLDPVRFSELDVTRVVVSRLGADAGTVLPAGSRLARRVADVEVWETPSLGPVFLDDRTVPRGLRLRRDLRRPERLVVEVPAAAAGRRVVVSEALAPGWSATPSLPLVRHHGLLMSFDAPAGGGRVVLRYRTPGLEVGAGLSLVALVAVALALAWGRPAPAPR